MKLGIPHAKNYEVNKYRRLGILIFGIIIFIIICSKLATLKSKPASPTDDTGHGSVMDTGDLKPQGSVHNAVGQGSDIDDIKKFKIGETGVIPDADIEDKLEKEEDVILLAAIKNLTKDDSGTLFDQKGNEIGLRFLVLSDCGGQDTPPYQTHAQMRISHAMDMFAASHDVSFILSLGDNFSPAGVKDLQDQRFEDTFEDAFSGRALKALPWYIVAGNDDYKGNISAEIAYSKISKRWNFDRLNYMISGSLPTHSDVGVDILMIDTVQLCGRLPTNGRVEPMGPDDEDAAEKTWLWIENKLKSSNAEYLLVAGHYPVYSGGKHGSTQCLEERLQPLLERYRVSAYMAGHDHSLQHIKSPGEGGVHYFITGATSPDEDRLQHLDGIYRSSRYYWTNHFDKNEGAFTYCDIRKDSMKVEFINSKRNVLHTAHVLPRNNPVNQHPVQTGDDPAVHEIPVLEKHRKMPPSPREVQQQIRKESAARSSQQHHASSSRN